MQTPVDPFFHLRNCFYQFSKSLVLLIKFTSSDKFVATPEADRSELKALEEVFCNNRQDPLLVGSIMSNIGLTQAASGIASIIKVAYF